MFVMKKTIRSRIDPTRKGFTLVEILVVLGMITLIAAVALPGLSRMLTSGADEQAYNLIMAQLGAARAQAMMDGNYVGVHFQRRYTIESNHKNVELKDIKFWYCRVEYDRNNGAFEKVEGYQPSPLPQKMAVGEVMDSNSFSGANGNFDDFTSFTIVFSPSGSVVRQVEETGKIVFNSADDLFIPPPGGGPKDKIWDSSVANEGVDGERGATAMVLFNYTDLRGQDDYSTYLENNGQILAVNAHTGQLFGRE